MAWRKELEVDPVGCGCGAPVPPDGRACGDVTPWRSRHCRRAEFCDAFCDVPEPDDDEEPDEDELVPQPLTARTDVSTTAPSTAGVAARPGKLRKRRVNKISFTGSGPARAVPTRARRGASPCAVKGAGLAISLRLPGKFLDGGPGFQRCSWPSGGSDACGQVSFSTLAANGRRT
jgi:hypothetical protein